MVRHEKEQDIGVLGETIRLGQQLHQRLHHQLHCAVRVPGCQMHHPPKSTTTRRVVSVETTFLRRDPLSARTRPMNHQSTYAATGAAGILGIAKTTAPETDA